MHLIGHTPTPHPMDLVTRKPQRGGRSNLQGSRPWTYTEPSPPHQPGTLQSPTLGRTGRVAGSLGI